MTEKIKNILDGHKVVLFMKGNASQPYCGFSQTAVKILQSLSVNFKDVNVLEDEVMRADLKVYFDWPTFPMLCVNGALIGGVDIMMQLYQTDKLKNIVLEEGDHGGNSK